MSGVAYSRPDVIRHNRVVAFVNTAKGNGISDIHANLVGDGDFTKLPKTYAVDAYGYDELGNLITLEKDGTVKQYVTDDEIAGSGVEVA